MTDRAHSDGCLDLLDAIIVHIIPHSRRLGFVSNRQRSLLTDSGASQRTGQSKTRVDENSSKGFALFLNVKFT